MVPLQRFANRVLADVIRRQPSSPERTAFAWQLAVGSTLARSTTISQQNDVLIVRPRDERWRPELERSADIIVLRLQSLLGPAAIRRIDVRLDTPLAAARDPQPAVREGSGISDSRSGTSDSRSRTSDSRSGIGDSPSGIRD
jgi:phosphohistidine swiveling domain-containing protein